MAKDPRKKTADRAKRAALRALRKARLAAETTGIALSDWEGEFLGSVEGRVEKYGRAFRDPEKGGAGQSLSIRQAVKLKEIAGKTKPKPKKKPEPGMRQADCAPMRRSGFKRRKTGVHNR